MTFNLLPTIKQHKYNFIFAVVFAFSLLLPDFIFDVFFQNIKYLTDYLFILALIVFGFILSFTGLAFFSLVLFLLLTMQTIQLFHIAYFARPINPLDISKIFSEFTDIYQSGIGDIDDVWGVIPLLILTFGGIFFTFFKYRKQFGFSIIAIIIITGALCVKPERAIRKALKSFLPADTRYSVHNSINSFSYFLVKSMDNLTIDSIVPKNFYQPYIITQNNRELPKLIVLVMGESLSSSQMSLYHPEIPETTPHLDNQRNNPNFLYRLGISGAVSTHSSLPIFFNMMKEPGNIELFNNSETNLFKLAKQSGYTTHFLSAYDVKQTHNIGVPYIDDIRTVEQNLIAYARHKEDYMVDLFNEMDVSDGRHFVVLNFKSVHSPYNSNYSHRKDEFNRYQLQENHTRQEEAISYYRNAVLYNDDIISRMQKDFEAKAQGSGYFMITADHGELLGQNGYFGHNILQKNTAEVPFILYSPSPDKDLYAKLKQQQEISHYEMAETLADLLGYSVQNPNSDDHTFYIHGNNLYEDHEIIELKRQNSILQPAFRGSVSTFIEQRRSSSLPK